MGIFNATCPVTLADIRTAAEKPIIGSLDTQHLLFYISLGFSAITVLAAGSLAITHLFNYSRPREQRQIVRICFYPVVFALLSTFSIFDYAAYIYLEPIRNMYEPIALASLFLLLVEFAAPNPSSREEYFDNLENRKQEGGKCRRRRKWKSVPGGSLRWFQSKWVALEAYFFASVVIRIVEIITQAAGRFCQTSFSPAFAHIWVTVISNIALPVGLLAVLQFYMRMKSESHFTEVHNPTKKLISFKAVIGLNFLQEIVFEILIAGKIFKGTSTVTLRDFQVGIPATLIAIEQAIVAIWFHWTFGVKEYRSAALDDHEKLSSAHSSSGKNKMNVFAAAANALNPMDLITGCIYAGRLLAAGVGPYGNGSWRRRSGGYNKIKDAAGNIRMDGTRSSDSSTYHGAGAGQYNNGAAGYEYMRGENPVSNINNVNTQYAPPAYHPSTSPSQLHQGTVPTHTTSLTPPTPYEGGYMENEYDDDLGAQPVGSYGNAYGDDQARLLDSQRSRSPGPAA